VGAPLLYLGWRELDGRRGVDQVTLQADWLLVPGYVLAGVGVFGLGALFLYGSGPGGSHAGASAACCWSRRPTSPRTWPRSAG
jgi:hypothetical protein